MTKCFFSNLQKITIAELRNAKQSVCIAVAWINFDIYFPVFAELLSQGICVQIIINDDANIARYRNQIENLILQGAKITLINAIGIMHHKEGVDVPEINQVIMLRPTESPIVFI